MGRLALSLSLALLLLAALCRGDDFNLEDAVGGDDSKKTAAPPPQPKPGSHGHSGGDDFNLEDAVGGDDSKKTAAPPPQPKPGSHGQSGGFEDSDLLDGDLPPENPQSGHPSNPSSDSPGKLVVIISSIVVAIAGAVSSFIAYQKKKLCFKASDQENIPVESQQGAHVQRILLQKQ